MRINHLMPEKEKYFCVNSDSRRGGEMLANALLGAGHRDIVYVENSQICIRKNPRCSQFFRCLAEAGITYTGFGDIAEYQRFDPFPTISQEPYELGDSAAETLISIAEGKTDLSSPFTRIIPVELKGENYIRRLI